MRITPEQKRAQNRAGCAVHYAKKMGILVDPGHCQRCGSTKRREAHHADYSKPLEVEWLCRMCHRMIHKRPKRPLRWLQALLAEEERVRLLRLLSKRVQSIK
jgi:hypothetical protein